MKTQQLGLMLALLFTLTGCSIMAQSVAPLVQHDLGGNFTLGAARPQTPLRSVTVSGASIISIQSMFYRDMAIPTQRSAYANNRWAATPSTLTSSAIDRLMGVATQGKCRLQISMSDFIIEVETDRSGRAVIPAELRLFEGNNLLARQVLDIAEPIGSVTPQAGVLAMREAVIRLANQAKSWVDSEAGKACRT